MKRTISDEVIQEVRRRASLGLHHGDQKTIAMTFGLTRPHLNMILKGIRRKP